MNNKSKTPFYKNISCFDLLFWTITLVASYYYISENAYKLLCFQIPSSDYTPWHDMYAYLNDGFIAPIQYFVVLLLFFEQYLNRNMRLEVLLRCKTKASWYHMILLNLFKISGIYVILNYFLIFLLSAIRFGFPRELAWGNFPLSMQPVPIILFTSLLSRINISLYSAVVFAWIAILKNNCITSYFICAVYFLISNLILLITPPYMSFKGVAFVSSFSYQFFSEGFFINNLILAFITPLILDVLIISHTQYTLKKSVEVGLTI